MSVRWDEKKKMWKVDNRPQPGNPNYRIQDWFEDEQDADDLDDELEDQKRQARRLMRLGRCGVQDSKCSIGQLVQEYFRFKKTRIAERSYDDEQRVWRNLDPTFGKVLVRNFRVEDMDAHCQTRMEKDGVSVSEVNKEAAMLRRVFRWAVKKRKFPFNPMDSWEPEKGEPRKARRVLEEEEVERFLAHCPPSLYSLFLFLLCTGARLRRAVFLTWDRVCLDERMIYVTGDKGGKRRPVPICDRLLVDLQKLWLARNPKVAWVYPTQEGRPRKNTSNINREFWQTIRRAEIKAKYYDNIQVELDVHALRKTVNTHLLRAGVRDEVVKAILGHAVNKRDMTRGCYREIAPQELLDGIGKLPWGKIGREMDRARKGGLQVAGA